MAHTSATCLPFPSLLSSFLSIMNKDKEEEEVPFSFIEGQIDDSQTAAEASQAAVESCYSLDSHRLLHKSTTTNNTMLPSLPSSTSIAEEESGPRGLRLTSSNKSQKVVKKNMSSSLNSQVTIISFLLLIASLSLPCPCHGLELKPPTAEKEVFTGDSFVVTCLTDSPSSSDLKLSWLAPDGREVASVPTAPIYVSEKPDGLQIVFLRHAKKHSGRYMCVQRRVSFCLLFTTNFCPLLLFPLKSTSFPSFPPSLACHLSLPSSHLPHPFFIVCVLLFLHNSIKTSPYLVVSPLPLLLIVTISAFIWNNNVRREL